MRYIFLTFAILTLSGCTSVQVIPPTELDAPVPVFLLDHGRHTSLIVPAQEGIMMRYAYGDRRYYAYASANLSTGFSALFRNTPAVLGRKVLTGPAEVGYIRSVVQVHIERILVVHVERQKVNLLLQTLETLFAQHEVIAYRWDIDLEFSAHPVPYSLTHNSNRAIADWLKILGCEIQGRPILSNWHILTPSEAVNSIQR